MKNNFLEDLYDEYFFRVELYAKDMFKNHILPYLKKYNLEFVSGNGTFYLSYTNKTPKWFIRKYKGYYWQAEMEQVDIDKLPNKIQRILNMEIGGYNYPLGSIMPDYNVIGEQDGK
jgi:hypothetical protein